MRILNIASTRSYLAERLIIFIRCKIDVFSVYIQKTSIYSYQLLSWYIYFHFSCR